MTSLQATGVFLGAPGSSLAHAMPCEGAQHPASPATAQTPTRSISPAACHAGAWRSQEEHGFTIVQKTRHRRRWPYSRPRSSGRGGFTLIELLIVVAILAIFSASSLVIVTAPMCERVYADIEAPREAGLATLLPALVADAHAAASAEAPEGAFVLRGAAAGGGDVAYFVDTVKQLRRAQAAAGASVDELRGQAAGAALIEDIEAFSATRDEATGLWRVTLRAATTRLAREMTADRTIAVGVGKTWAGGGR